MRLLPWPRRGEKAVTSHTHGAGGRFLSFLSNFSLSHRGEGHYDYSSEIGTGTRSSVLMAPIQFIQRSMPESPLVVEREVRGGEWEIQPDHDAARLIENPNPFYSGVHLWNATLFSYATDGNAYWIIVRNRGARPTELWYAPHWMIEPQFPRDGSEFISHYSYRPGGEPIRLEVEDVIHFRHGINPENPRKGISPLNSVLRDVWVDDESSKFVAALLRNGGVPGLVISPDSDEPIAPNDVEEFKQYIRQNFGGKNRGSTLVASSKTKIDRVGFSPRELDLSAATDRPEERVCALLGIPAAVVGFAAGLEQTKVGATMKELRELAWYNGIMPIQRTFADELERSLLPMFSTRARTERMTWDRSEVAALAEDRNKVAERVNTAVQGGWMTVSQAKRMLGLEPEAGDDIYLRRITTIAVPEGQIAPARPAPGSDQGDQGMRASGQHPATLQIIPGGRKADHSPFEHRMAEERPRVEARPEQQAFMRAQEATAPALQGEMEKELRAFFVDTLGERAAREALPILDDELKQTAQDQVIVDRVIQAMAMQEIVPIFAEIYERHYLRVAETTAESMEALGLATDIPDPVARAIIATSGRRAGLVDLTEQTKRALFVSLEEARAEGEGVEQIVRRIRDDIPAGPWRTPETRARVIARTETKHAQRTSTLELAKGQDVERFRVFDARMGATDEVCEALDGRLVSAQEADQLALEEHPNGTRDFVPYFGEPPATEATG